MTQPATLGRDKNNNNKTTLFYVMIIKPACCMDRNCVGSQFVAVGGWVGGGASVAEHWRVKHCKNCQWLLKKRILYATMSWTE